jgi:hypothetical protein
MMYDFWDLEVTSRNPLGRPGALIINLILA